MLDEGCYVLYVENPANIATRSLWIFAEAHATLQRLPKPSKTKNTEAELTIRVRDLKHLEAGSPDFEHAVLDVARLLSKSEMECLGQLVQQGPVEDGDLVSKSPRDKLLNLGLATKVVVAGQDGFNAANYLGFKVFKAKFSKL